MVYIVRKHSILIPVHPVFSSFFLESLHGMPFHSRCGRVTALHGQGQKVVRPTVMHEVIPAAGLPQRL